MKLHPANIAARNYRRIHRAVFSLSDDNVGIVRLTIERMHKVEERLIGNARKQRMRRPLANLIPADLWDYQIPSKTSHSARQKTEPRRSPKLFRLFKEHLHADAHAEQWRSLSYSFLHEIAEAALGQRLHASRKRADTWKDKPLGPAQLFFVGSYNRNAAGRGESFLYRTKIADSVIDDGHLSHVVLGSIGFSL